MAIHSGDHQKPELLSPAGDWASLTAAVESGADAVYFGVKGMNMRHLAANFHLNELPKVMDFLHGRRKKGYLTLNTVMLPSDLERAQKILEKAKTAGIDAVILWDMAVFRMAKALGLRIHVSTQASVANPDAVQWYARQGAKQIVLARECTLADIRKIIRTLKKDRIACRIETFVHGAMCVSVSGRCFLSQETFGLSANQGKCLQPCRREYAIRDTEGECEYVVGTDYVLSPKDLCTIEFIDELIKSGIASFKIEGRMRAPEYVRVVTQCYRQAIDAYFSGELTDALKVILMAKLREVYHRGFSSGFFFGQPDNEAWSKGLEHTREKVFAGEVTRFFKKILVAEVRLLSAPLVKGDRLVIIGHQTPGLECEL
ncbi:MAG TPA: peptidase U32 family protein, partial [Candidatus Bathyarchaeia archaeon]|nr:peptidase U32 family protein [Candidatus Bathyarchaeia archaeon]